MEEPEGDVTEAGPAAVCEAFLSAREPKRRPLMLPLQRLMCSLFEAHVLSLLVVVVVVVVCLRFLAVIAATKRVGSVCLPCRWLLLFRRC